MLNLSLKELRLIAKNRNINGSKSMPKDKLLGIINNITRETERAFLNKKEKTKRSLYKPTRNKKIEKSLNKLADNYLFKSKIKKSGKFFRTHN